MKIYVGWRATKDNDTYDPIVMVQHDDFAPAYPLRHAIYHSPTGFEWGYPGSGPADLALAILLDHFGEWGGIPYSVRKAVTQKYTPGAIRYLEKTRAWRFHQRFKELTVCKYDDGWTLTAVQVNALVELMEHEMDRRYAADPTDDGEDCEGER